MKRYLCPSPRPHKYTMEGHFHFLKMKAGTRNIPEDQEMSSGLEFRSIAGASDLTDRGDLAEIGSRKKKKNAGQEEEKCRTKGKPRK